MKLNPYFLDITHARWRSFHGWRCFLFFSISTFGKDNDGRILPFVPITVSTVPANGDVNPYGVAFVPNGFLPGGLLNPGDILVSNFNDNQNLQGTGTTIVKISPSGQQSLFFKGNPPLGLTTALVALKRGFVVVGNLPTADGTAATVKPGSLLFIKTEPFEQTRGHSRLHVAPQQAGLLPPENSCSGCSSCMPQK